MSTAKSVKPLPGFIVIEEIEPETKTASGLVLPDTAQEKPQIGKIIEKGEATQRRDFVGEVINDIPVKKGDIIAFQKYTGHPIKIEGKEYQIVGFDKLLAIIE